MGGGFKVLEIARKELVLCRPSDSLLFVANLMLEKKVGSVLVESDHDIVGIVTKNDLLRAAISHRTWEQVNAKDVRSWEQINVKDVMSHPVATCNAEDTIRDALDKFRNTHYSRLAVIDKTGKIVAVAKHKIVERFVEYYHLL